MTINRTITEQVKDRQKLVFRLACDPSRYGMTKKAISADSTIGYDSLCDYANGETEMSLSALVRLIGVLPNELLSLLLPEGQAIVAVPDEVDHDQLADAVAEYLAVKNAAHGPESPAGRDISDCEKQKLNTTVVHLPLKGKVNAA
jgi:hypothetical protein